MEEYSDMDVFIEVPFVDKVLKRKIIEISWEVGIDNSRVICVLAFTKAKVEDYLLHESSLILNIFREGVQIAI